MTPTDIKVMALAAEARNIGVTLVLKNKPKQFPRGELLCINAAGHKVYLFDPIKLLEWCRRVRQAMDEKT